MSAEKLPRIDLETGERWLHSETRHSLYAKHARAVENELNRLRREVITLGDALALATGREDRLRAEVARLESLWDKDTAERDMYAGPGETS